MTRLVFIDTETTGLDPDRHEIWELALITDDGREFAWQLPVDLAIADPMALQVGRFYNRRWTMRGAVEANDVGSIARILGNGGTWVATDRSWPSRAAGEVAALLSGVHLVGATPQFDAAFLARWLRAHGHAPTWHYHLIDVEALAVGWMHGRAAGVNYMSESPSPGATATVPIPWKSEELSRRCGVEPPDDLERHTALGDARWVRRWYETITGDSR